MRGAIVSKKVLIVDDEEGMRRILSIVLERAGYEIIVAADGQTGLDLIYSEKPEVIIMDDMMPGLSGGEVCQRIKSDLTLNHIRIIMHSASVNMQSHSYIQQIGADHALTKPCPAPVMLDTIARCMSAPV